MSKHQWIMVAVVVWISFLSAAVATLFFFATFDPSILASVATFPMELDRNTGYALGFFLFWSLLFANGAVTAWLITLPAKPNKNKPDKNSTNTTVDSFNSET